MEIEKMMCVLEGICPDCVIEDDPFGVDLGILHVGDWNVVEGKRMEVAS